MSLDLTGQVAAVTGAGRGIGQAIAVALAEAGADIVGIGPGRMTETARRIAATGHSFHQVHADLSETTLACDVIKRAIAAAGRVDVLVNSASPTTRADARDDADTDWAQLVAAALRAPFFLSQAAARHMIATGRPGRIINVASLLGVRGSSHGVAGITRALALELGAHRITVNAIAPGHLAPDETGSPFPPGRWGQPGDIAGAAVFLASAASADLNGAIVPVDGGWLGR